MKEPPVVNRPTQVDRLAWYRERARHIKTMQNLAFGFGLLLCVVINLMATVVESNIATQARVLGLRPEEPPFSSATVFWLGMALIGISELLGIQLAIRETHIQRADRGL
jgi:hypothetical protein